MSEKSEKRVYLFEEGSSKMRNVLGGKGCELAEMTRIGLPVPPGFTITAQMCIDYNKAGKKMPEGVMKDVEKAMKKLEEKTGKKFGDAKNPLLVSVRSGARASMPGMMDTVLNLGLNDETAKGLAAKTGNERFVFDAYRRFITMFGDVVLGVDHDKFEEILHAKKEKKKVKLDTELNADDLKQLVAEFKEMVKKEKNAGFPTAPFEQLKLAIEAVFESWDNKRAITYRNLHGIPHDWGTAVNVQVMVFGNMGEESGTGVAFTRDPATGEKKLYGEYLMNAQGEDVVAGIRTPLHISELAKQQPKIFKQFDEIAKTLEKHYRDMQDMEFTIEKGKLYMLQTRNGKRTAAAAVKVAVDMMNEGLITKEEALLRVEPKQLDQLLHKRIDPKAAVKVLAKGLAASPGAASGKAVFTADEAETWAKKGEKVVLVRAETTPDDIHGMVAAKGILTSRGGNTSHAAVVARGMGKPCIVGCEAIKVDAKGKKFEVNGITVREGDHISMDGGDGRVILGEVKTIEPELTNEFKTLLSWADETKRLGVWTNADTPKDAEKAFEFGAQGVGLCRTEHMFFNPERIPVVQQMILADNLKDRQKALDKLLPMQKEDFVGIFKAMKGYPVIIRLIDPPLHEFLPQREELMVQLAVLKEKGQRDEQKEKLFARVEQLHEFNPMLGLRGCRLCILYPEILVMQVKAIMEAAVAVKKSGVEVKPRIMIPLVGHVNELELTARQTREVAEKVLEAEKVKVDYKVGTMIEIPRAALTSGEIAKVAEFYSFGTNDLTQMTFGYSRDDAEGKFLAQYVDKGILPKNPFVTLDATGVGRLIKMCVKEGRETNPKLSVGICGEHGGDPESVEFCHGAGLDYVSCSPFRVPLARLAAAQAVVKEKKAKEEKK